MVDNVLSNVRKIGVDRVRISFINMYNHVIDRLRKNELIKYMKYTSFYCPDFIKYEILDYLSVNYEDLNFELCADLCEKKYKNIHQIGCISNKDIEILSLGNGTNQLEYGTQNRKGCLCSKNKVELLSNKCRCDLKCAYCYWKD